MHRKIKNSNFFIGANSSIDVERLKQESGGANIIDSHVKMTVPSDWKNYPLKFLKNKLIDHNPSILKNNPDCVIVLGGDDLSEYYDKWRISFDLINLWLLQRRTRVFVIGQTIGPFYSYRKALSRFCLKNIPIYVRDPNNSKYLKNELRIMHSIEASDLALLRMPLENHSSYNLQSNNLVENEYITIVPSGLRYKYTSDEESYIKEWHKIVEFTLILL